MQMNEPAYIEAVAERSDTLRKARQQIAALEKENFILNDVLITQTRRTNTTAEGYAKTEAQQAKRATKAAFKRMTAAAPTKGKLK
jgi:hypothetical protein